MMLNFSDINKISLLDKYYSNIIDQYYKYLYSLHLKNTNLIYNSKSYKYNFLTHINNQTNQTYQQCCDISYEFIKLFTIPFKLSNKLFDYTQTKLVNVNANIQLNKLLTNFDWKNIIFVGEDLT